MSTNLIRKLAKQKAQAKFIVPYGRHSYGPQPEILGGMPYAAKTARGSKVGNFCSIGSGLKFSFLGKHHYEWISTYPFYEFYERWHFENSRWKKGVLDENKIDPHPIIVENDVWLAKNVTIQEGVKICNGAVVAMDSLVTKDVPPYAVVGGNPAKIIKYRFRPNQIDELLKIAWWSWKDEEISEILPLLMSSDVDGLIECCKG